MFGKHLISNNNISNLDSKEKTENQSYKNRVLFFKTILLLKSSFLPAYLLNFK